MTVPAPIVTEPAIIRLLEEALNGMLNAWTIAHTLERRHRRKPGSLHLAVKLCMRRMETKKLIVVLPPKDQWDSYMLCLPQDHRQRLSAIPALRDTCRACGTECGGNCGGSYQ